MLVSVIDVPDPPVPLASFNNAPFKVVVNDPKILYLLLENYVLNQK